MKFSLFFCNGRTPAPNKKFLEKIINILFFLGSNRSTETPFRHGLHIRLKSDENEDENKNNNDNNHDNHNNNYDNNNNDHNNNNHNNNNNNNNYDNNNIGNDDVI